MSLEPGGVFEGKYEILHVLATGGMSAVYAARHLLTRETVALKVLASGTNNRTAERRFKLEVSVGAKVQHAGIVRVFDAGTDAAGRFYFTMELLRGCDLAALLNDPDATVATLLKHVLDAVDILSAAHAVGVVHRDIKPENIFVERTDAGEARVRLLDFGIARDLGSARATATGSTLGTALYMAPEQATDVAAICKATDVWAFGVILYEILAGVPPFSGDSPHAVIIDAVTKPHLPLADARPDLPEALTGLVDRCLEKSPAARPRDAAELRSALAPLLAAAAALPRPTHPPRVGEGNTTDAADPPSTPVFLTPHRRTGTWTARRAPVLVAVSLLVAALASVGVGLSRLEEAEPTSSASEASSPPLAPEAMPARSAPPSIPTGTEAAGIAATVDARASEARAANEPAANEPTANEDEAPRRASARAQRDRRRRAGSRRRGAGTPGPDGEPRASRQAVTRGASAERGPAAGGADPAPPTERPSVLQGVSDFDSQAQRINH